MATQPGSSIPDTDEALHAGEKSLTLFEHLNELQRRLTYASLTVVLATVIALVFANDIIDFATGPARDTDPDFQPIFTELLGFFSAYVKVGLLVGVTTAMPMILYQGLAFVTPGLTPSERRWLLPIAFFGALSFVGGVAFAYYVAWPPALEFLLNFGNNVADPQIRINNYIDTLTRFLFWTGLVFQMPLVLMGLGYVGVLRARQLVKGWRWAMIGAFVLAALITPSVDPVTQAAVAFPLIGLYGLGILLVRLVQNRGLGRSE